MTTTNPFRAWILALGATLAPGLAAADCTGFKWDVSAERALFATAPAKVASGLESAQAKRVEPGRLYTLDLWPQETVTLAATPSKQRLSDGAYAGLVRFGVPAPGAYRVALTQGAWIDVVDGGRTVPSDDFSGSPDCAAPRKVVVYTLPTGRELVLQVTGGEEERIGFAITPVVRP